MGSLSPAISFGLEDTPLHSPCQHRCSICIFVNTCIIPTDTQQCTDSAIIMPTPVGMSLIVLTWVANRFVATLSPAKQEQPISNAFKFKRSSGIWAIRRVVSELEGPSREKQVRCV
jgi:hypothetical protein